MSLENSNIEEPTTVTFLDKLRNKTSASHKNLESLPISKSIVNPKITIEEYALYLSLMHDVVKNLEEDIYPILSDAIPDLNERKKTHFILNDLKFTKSEKKQNHSPFDATGISVPFAMGIMYVVEGSTLGGRFIIKNIQESFGFDEENGASYFGGYGNKTGSFWKKFLNSMTDFEQQTNSEKEIISGADYAFRAIHKHLSENSVA
ncbi:heme oxygenase [Flavobacterium arsenatis]|uniref:Heme oxygenase n=1 Tax=Flavobacterium arsenatis TaxID=1484332 RepID=A0ABU1TRC6_9FLAO|nr:biliverdin-producing heme oxygenase [Flavobacterium arsenatis]MDR6968423.1 heme oxygenase [Flavobacterium arsenatis]